MRRFPGILFLQSSHSPLLLFSFYDGSHRLFNFPRDAARDVGHTFFNDRNEVLVVQVTLDKTCFNGKHSHDDSLKKVENGKYSTLITAKQISVFFTHIGDRYIAVITQKANVPENWTDIIYLFILMINSKSTTKCQQRKVWYTTAILTCMKPIFWWLLIFSP